MRDTSLLQLGLGLAPPWTVSRADFDPEAHRLDIQIDFITFDKFHAVKVVNDAVDQVRRAEQKQQSVLRGTRYIWLRNPANLSERQKATLESLPTRHLKTARAYQIRLAFQDLYEQPPEAAASYLKKWYFWATHSRLEPIIDAADTVKRHRDGILRWFDSQIANGLIEGINSLVQAAKSKARGYRSIRNLKAMVYLLAGKLDMRLPA
jgi:transposase